MKAWNRLVMGCVLVAMGLGFGLSIQAGERIAIVMDPGANDRQNRQMATRMERDLKNVLDKRGRYSSRILKAKSEFTKESGEYLLEVRITRYNAGSKAARMIVGFGAGSASLDIHYELSGPKGNVLLSKDDGCGTSLDWQRLARKLNETILTSIQERFKAGNLDAGGPVPAQPGAAPVAPAAVPAPAVTPAPVVPATPTPAVTPPPVVSTAPAVEPQSVAPAQSAAPADDPVEALRRLDFLKREGRISSGEYKLRRKEILRRM